MEKKAFESRVAKLEKNVYETVKGKIRLTLLQQDLDDFCPLFAAGGMQILDVGGGSGRFARICAERGHQVTLCDSSPEMLRRAEVENARNGMRACIRLVRADFLADDCCFDTRFDLVVMHGSAEWMDNPEGAIRKACACIRPGGYLSLLVFNKDRNMLKQGINGLLLQRRRGTPKSNLTPPGALSPAHIRLLLDTLCGRILLQSGIRVFYRFFRQGVDEEKLSPEQWLAQEKQYYRR